MGEGGEAAPMGGDVGSRRTLCGYTATIIATTTTATITTATTTIITKTTTTTHKHPPAAMRVN